MTHGDDFGLFMAGLLDHFQEKGRREDALFDLALLPSLGPRAVESASRPLVTLAQSKRDALAPEEWARVLRHEPVSPLTQATLALVARLEAFPATWAYEGGDGAVQVRSGDGCLERALHFGTRNLPRLQPLRQVTRFLNRAIPTTR